MKKSGWQKNKLFKQGINLALLEEISDSISENYNAFAHAYSFKKSKDKKKHKFEYYNLLCTCVANPHSTIFKHYVIDVI